MQDAEIRFEDQISKLVLEKQELEWEKVQLSNWHYINILNSLKHLLSTLHAKIMGTPILVYLYIV